MGIFIGIAVCVQMGVSGPFDAWAYAIIAAGISDGATAVMKALSYIGDKEIVIAICLLLIIIKGSRKTVALPLACSLGLSALCNKALKSIFARPRPEELQLVIETNYSFPSGHAMNNMVLYLMLILFILSHLKNTRLQVALVVACSGLVLMIGLSRVYLGVHYPTDVLAGWSLGACFALTAYTLWQARQGA